MPENCFCNEILCLSHLGKMGIHIFNNQWTLWTLWIFRTLGHCRPRGPCQPWGPRGPCQPWGPFGPCGPCGPCRPCESWGPKGHCGPRGSKKLLTLKNFEDHIDLFDIVDIKDLLNIVELVDLVDHMDLLDLEGICSGHRKPGRPDGPSGHLFNLKTFCMMHIMDALFWKNKGEEDFSMYS